MAAAETPYVIWWVRNWDLRVDDNPAFLSAVKSGYAVLPVYISAPHEDGAHGCPPNTAVAAWLQHALQSFKEDLLQLYQMTLVVMDASSSSTSSCLHQLLDGLQSHSRCRLVVHNACASQHIRHRDYKVHAQLTKRKIKVMVHEGGNYLYAMPDIINAVALDNVWHGHYMTLMSVLKPCSRQLGPPPQPKDKPHAKHVTPFKTPSLNLFDTPISDLRLIILPQRSDGTTNDWTASISAAWGPMTEEAGQAAMRSFISDGLARFERQRHRADNPDNNSRLSPYLRFGQISSRRVYWSALKAKRKDLELTSSTFQRRLMWRDLANLQLHLYPRMADQKAIRQHYEMQTWNPEQSTLVKAWQQGKTGYPLVDAAMRQLYATGWMQTNVRMVAASFLCEYCNCDWRYGELWFAATLVDADQSINAMMWQNAGKCGFDQWNFKINPIFSKHVDPTGQYIRTWVPELSALPLKLLAEPWRASADALSKAGVVLDSTYPRPVISPDELAQRAQSQLNQLVKLRAANQRWNNQEGYDLVDAPDGQPTRVYTRKDLRVDKQGDLIDPNQRTRKPRHGQQARTPRNPSKPKATADAPKKSKPRRRGQRLQ
eukprot:m.49955 g.49955  ORF g.49955 m.49955 type:complete len:600 (-) comp13381_c0_seq2:41-1840(-)